MPKKRCGDPAGFTFRVTEELVGRNSTTIVTRRGAYFNISASHTEELERAERMRVKWPDLQIDGEPEGNFYGGRRVDFSGLNRLSYREKFEQQEFGLNFYVGGNASRESSRRPIRIEAYDDVDEDRQLIGFQMDIERWQYNNTPTLDVATGAEDYSSCTFSRTAEYPEGTFRTPTCNCGKFIIDIRDGVLVLIVKVHLTTTETAAAGEGLDVVFAYIKRRVERFWNSRVRGFNQWIYHREDCERGENCDCSILRDSRGHYITAGCCKIPFRVFVEQGDQSDDLTNVVNLRYMNPTQRQEALDNEAGSNFWGAGSLPVGVCTTDLYYPENRINTYAHEFGHMLGFPDQYPNCGCVQRSAMSTAGPVPGVDWPIDDDSVMGMLQGEAKIIHAGASWFNDWINDNLDEDFDLIED